MEASAGDFDLEEAKRMLENRNSAKPAGSSSGKSNWYSLPDDGEVLVRILPPAPGEKVPGKLVYTHWNIPLEDNKIHCFRTYDMECPVCDLIEEYQARTNVEDIVADVKCIWDVLVIRDPSQPAIGPTTPMLMRGGDFNYWWLMEQRANPEVGDITHPKEGHNVTFKRKKFKGAFDRIISLKPSPLAGTDAEIAEILEKRHDFSKIWRTPDDNYLKKMKEVVVAVKDLFENQILQNGGSGPAPAQQQKVDPATAANATAPTQAADTDMASTPKTDSRPANTPECWGNKEIYYAGFGDEDSANKAENKTEEQAAQIKKCTNCPYEYRCETEIKRTAAG